MDAESGADFRLIFLGDALVDKSQNRLLIALGIGGRKISRTVALVYMVRLLLARLINPASSKV